MISRHDFRYFLRPMALCALLVVAACAQPAATPVSVESARSALAAGNAADARVVLERLLAEGGERSHLAALLGEAALASGDEDAAAQWLVDAEFSPDTRALGFRMLGRLETLRGNLRAAGKAFDVSHSENPESADLWVDIGRLRYLGGEHFQAIDAADRAMALDPASAAALQFRGQLVRDYQGSEAGAAWFARAVENNPANTDLRLEYAATLADGGRARESLDALRAAGGRARTTPRGHYIRAVIAARGRNFALSRELLQRSGLVREDVPSALLLSAVIDLEEGNFASAAQTLDRLHTRQPDNARVVDLFALALSRSGSERELIQRFDLRARDATGSAYLRTLVGRAHETLGNRAEAASLLDLAAAARSTLAVLPGTTPSDALSTRTGDRDLQARDIVRDAIGRGRIGLAYLQASAFATRNPGSADAWSLLGDAEYARGNKMAARAAYFRSARVRQPWPLTLRIASTQNDPVAAQELLESYVRGHPANGQAAAMLADAYAAQGRWSDAANLLDHAMRSGMARVPWVLASRSVAAGKLGDADAALDYALAAHELQPMNPPAIAALIAALPDEERQARAELSAKLASLPGT